MKFNKPDGNYNPSRVELVLIGLNRKYPQKTNWECSERQDDDLKFATEEYIRIFPIDIFNDCANVLDVWAYIEKYWDVDKLKQFNKDAKDVIEYGAAFGKIVGLKRTNQE